MAGDRRTESDVWELHEARTKETLTLDCIGATLEVDAIYFDAFAARPSEKQIHSGQLTGPELR